jgi:hypothetical protein
MTKDDCKKLVIDIISDIAPDEDLSAITNCSWILWTFSTS